MAKKIVTHKRDDSVIEKGLTLLLGKIAFKQEVVDGDVELEKAMA